VPDYQEVFWGNRGLSRREERLAVLGDRTLAVLTPLLHPGETLSILFADVGGGWIARRSIAISEQRVFVVRWDRAGRCKDTMIADCCSVSARVKVRDEGGNTLKIHAPSWGTIEVSGNEVARKAHEAAGLLNERSLRQKPDERSDGGHSTLHG
jgi:hypothetical protein